MKNNKYLPTLHKDMLKASYINHKHFKPILFSERNKKVKAIPMHYN